jgi:hypothetical protein
MQMMRIAEQDHVIDRYDCPSETIGKMLPTGAAG